MHNKVCSTYVYVGDDGEACTYFANQSQYIKLPCKVGDTVYVIDDRCGIVKCIVNEMHLGVNQEVYGDLFYYEQKADESPELVDVFDFDENDFGKTVFLIREEAEKALRERENK